MRKMINVKTDRESGSCGDRQESNVSTDSYKCLHNREWGFTPVSGRGSQYPGTPVMSLKNFVCCREKGLRLM